MRKSIYCLFSIALIGCRLDFAVLPQVDSASSDQDAAPEVFQIGGTAAGTIGPGLVLQNNVTDVLSLTQAGRFVFSMTKRVGDAYDVRIVSTPAATDCIVTNGTGVVAASHVGDIQVVCFAQGQCPSGVLTFHNDAMFQLPSGCSTFTVDAYGGGGGGGAKHKGAAAAAGGVGGHAVVTLTAQVPGSMYEIKIGAGGGCDSRTAVLGAYTGGGGGIAGGNGTGVAGAGDMSLGGSGGVGSSGAQPGGAGGNGGFGGGGGGGGGDTEPGNSGGGATAFRGGGGLELLVAGGGGGAGAADQNGDRAGAGGAACNGLNGVDGIAAEAGGRSGGGGGGGGCACAGGCVSQPTSTGAAGGVAGTLQACTPAQNGASGWLTLTFP